jgi:glycopeptide antibiotics resistance protein
VTFAKLIRLADTLFNLSLFVPVGMIIFWSLRRFFSESIRTLLCIALGAGILLSAGIELLQASIPQRVPSVSDVIANAGGAVLGCYMLYLRFVWKSGQTSADRSSSSEESSSELPKEVSM